MAGMIRWAALAVVLLALGGCYTSETFLLDGSKAARILATGKQVSTQPERANETVEVVPQPDGWYEMRAEKSAPVRMIFIPMPGQKDRFFLSVADTDRNKQAYMYGTAMRQGGKIGLDMTDCSEKPQAEIARRNGAKVEEFACTFTDGAGLTKALTEFAKIGRPMSKLATLPALP